MTTKRIRYDRGDLNSVIGAAKKLYQLDKKPRYIFATYLGYEIDKAAPFSNQRALKVTDEITEIGGVK